MRRQVKTDLTLGVAQGELMSMGVCNALNVALEDVEVPGSGSNACNVAPG